MHAVSRFATVVAIWATTALMLFWPGLAGRWRRTLSLMASAAGLVLLLVAVNTEGLREADSTAVFLLGTPYVTGHAAASASLPYYVVTGLFLLLGTVGLAINDEIAAALSRRFFLTAVAMGLGVALLRFGLEKVAAPASWTLPVGVTWLAPPVGAFFWVRIRAAGGGWRPLALALVGYGFLVRAFVALLYFGATRLRLGSHYDLSSLQVVKAPWGAVYHFEPGSLTQILNLAVFPQLVVWPVYTLVSGMLGAAVAALLAASWPGPEAAVARVPLGAAAGEDQ